MKLYELAHQFEELKDLYDDEIILDTLEGIEYEIEEKIDNIAVWIKELKAESEALDEESKRLQERARAKKNKIDFLKNYIFENMKKINKSKIETTRNVLSIRKNPPKLIIDEAKVPIDYITIEQIEKIDKEQIKNDLKDGKTIAGARLEQGESVNIK